MRHTRYLTVLTLSAFLWAGVGESSDPEVTAADLPADILGDCRATARTAIARGVCAEATYRIEWLGRTSLGHLYLVERDVCEADGCRAWLVAKRAGGTTHTLLSVTGELRLERQHGEFPVVLTRAELTESFTNYDRFEWIGEQYKRTETRLVHRVDGFECGDEDACRAAADEALRRQESDRAVKIWQQVHGINWI